MFDLASKYWHTVRYLKPRQVYGRILFRLARPRLNADAPAAPLRSPNAQWVEGIERPISMLGPQTFRFLNEEHDVEQSSWDSPGLSKLWRYNLHYFDDLNSVDAAARTEWHQRLLTLWVVENPPGVGSGWEAYPTSLRIVNWIKWSLRGNALSEACARSLSAQTRWLSKRLETHLLGNHLFVNAKALVFSGLYHDGLEADAWLERGLQILGRELPEQLLNDGAQFELSPMYQALAYEDVLDLCSIFTTYASALPARFRHLADAFRGLVPQMSSWLRAMSHPDGEIAFFNDAAFGVAATIGALDSYAIRLGLGTAGAATGTRSTLSYLKESRYARVEIGDLVAIMDLAEVGPDYLPAHAHADTLSFECSLFGQRVFVNSGTSVYSADAERQRQRGTAAHNTVVVNGENSSEVWGGFRVARRARTEELNMHATPPVTIRCAHDGYRRLAGKPTHVREWRFEPGLLEVKDVVRGGFESASAIFHLHPWVEISSVRNGDNSSEVDLRLDSGESARLAIAGGELVIEPSTWHPEFGKSIASRRLAVHFRGTTVTTRLTWT